MQTSNTIFLVLFGCVFAVVGVLVTLDSISTEPGPDSEPPWASVVMGSLFATVGIGITIVGVRLGMIGSRHQEFRRRYPDQPWQWRDDWRTGRIEHNAKWLAIAMWAFSILWNGIVVTAGVLGGGDLLRQASEDPAAYLFLLFPVVGLGVLYLAVRATMQWRRYGTSTLILRSVPVRIGEQLEATVQLPPDVRGASELKVQVSCSRTTRRGKNSTTTVLWSEERTYPGISLGVGPHGPTLSFRQDIPAGVEQSSVGSVNPSVHWKVEVTAEVEGVDFQADYTIPVFPG